MTQAFNLSQLANNLNTAGQLDATDGLVNSVPVANGGTGVSTLSGVAYGNGTSAFTAATSAQIASAIGATAVTNSTNSSKVVTTNFTVEESSGKLIFRYGSTRIFSIDSSGNLIVTANITAYGTP